MAKDLFHDNARKALENAGWTVTSDPLEHVGKFNFIFKSF